MRTALIDRVLRYLLPPQCARCHGSATRYWLCEGCWNDLPWNHSACQRCALPLVSKEQGLCRNCARRMPPQDHAVVPWRYAAPVDHWLQALKFERQLSVLSTLSIGLIQQLSRRAEPLPELLIPIPLHRNRRGQRGFNQSQELARVLADALSLHLKADALQRTRATATQSGSPSAAQRRRNIRGAFRVRADLQDRHIALLDDVITTASTMQEAAKVCRVAGAARIEIWAVARTP